MFGRDTRLPLNRGLGRNKDGGVENWVECHQEQLRQAYQKAGECLELEREERKMQYDRKIGSSDILVGQRVYLRNHCRV